jgi:hypothetical protein
MGQALAIALALSPYGAPPPPYFLTGYQSQYHQSAAIRIAGTVEQPETRMFRILRTSDR